MNINSVRQSFSKPAVSLETIESDDIQARQKALLYAALLTLWRHRLPLLAATLAGMLLGLAALLAVPKWYVSEAVLQLDLANADPGKAKLPVGATIDASALVEGEARLLRSRPMLGRVVRRLGLDKDREFAGKSDRPNWFADVLGVSNFQWNPLDRATARLAKATTITNDTRSYLINVSVAASTPEKAALVANAIGFEYFVDRVRRRLKDAEGSAAVTLSELRLVYGDKHPSVLVASSDLIAAQARSEATLTEVGADGFGLPANLPGVIALAAQPVHLAVGPSNILPVIGAFLGLVGGIAWILWGRREFRSTRAEFEVANISGAPCLGTVTYGGTAGGGDASPASSATLRSICNSAGLLPADAPPRVIVVTSISESDGRSKIVSGLATARVAAGGRVLVISPGKNGDSAAPMASLESIIATEASKQQFLKAANGRLNWVKWGSDAAGPELDLFGSPPMLDFLAQACRNFGSIILEVPSHLLASYPAQIAGYIDGVLLVAESGRTPAASLKVTVERFNEAAIKIIGIVLSQRAQAAQTSKGSRLMAQGAGSLAVWRQDGLPKIKDLSPGMQNAAENAAKLMQKANVFIRQR